MIITQGHYLEPSAKKVGFENNVNGEPELTIVYDSPIYEDSIEDIIKERILNNEKIEDVIESITNNAIEAGKRQYYKTILMKILTLIADSKNPALDVEVLIAATGIPLRGGVSHSTIAAKFGITRAAFSARVKKTLKKLDLPNPRACKNEKASATYRLTNKTKEANPFKTL